MTDLASRIDAMYEKLLTRLDEPGQDGQTPALNHVTQALVAAGNWLKLKRELEGQGEWGSALGAKGGEDECGPAGSGTVRNGTAWHGEVQMSDDIDRALEQARNGAGAGASQKVLGEIRIALIEVPGGTQTTMTCSIPDELVARGLYQKGAVILEMILAQRAAQNSPQVLRAGQMPPGLIERARKHMKS